MPLIPEAGRRHWKVQLTLLAIAVFLWVGVTLHMFPVYWVLTTSLKGAAESYQMPPTLWPKDPNPVAYKMFFRAAATNVLLPFPLWVYIKNSLILVGGVMLFQLPITALVGYSLAKLHSPRWNRILFLFFVGIMMIPGEVTLISHYVLLRFFPFGTAGIPNIPFTGIPFPHVNLLGTYWGIILPGTYSAFNVLLFKGYFDEIPDNILYAARADGASELTVFRKIVLPMSKPIFAVVGFFTFSGQWGSFLMPLIVLQKPDMIPLGVAIYQATEYIRRNSANDPRVLEYGAGWNAIMAFGVIESLPIIIGFIIFREYLMKGIKIKGFR